MRNLSLDQFYHRINKKILLVAGYTEDKQLADIIRACRLKPASVFYDDFDPSATLENVWVDEFNNHIEIKKKKVKVNLNKKRTQLTTTDIFRNASIEFLVNHSVLACIGLYPDTENFILLLKGSDNYFRCYTCQNNQLSVCSPLVVGMKVLRYCFPKRLKYFQKLTVKSEIKNMKEVEWFITTLPAQKLFIPNIATHSKLRSILYNE